MYVINVTIENSVINTAIFGKTKTIEGFFEKRGQKPIAIVKNFKDWNFRRVYLTHGNETNGSGFTFI